jgi:hypothetical protein
MINKISMYILGTLIVKPCEFLIEMTAKAFYPLMAILSIIMVLVIIVNIVLMFMGVLSLFI